MTAGIGIQAAMMELRAEAERRGWTPNEETLAMWQDMLGALFHPRALVVVVPLTDDGPGQLRELADRLASDPRPLVAPRLEGWRP